ncbi:DUF998 domain-containing protein [Undibacterium amnicola]|uniref:DUF998 domain-containing protein n=1 Tax=Undibacterium amnicola TaxID=1834038 RepID=A0ABR6XTH3_9BURK|nr:DUF998 domain-containing protein [Undibacterium amnicola]MBC3832299.1 DUF998 domain-containing protein [Undibacterium amnicola]
MRVLKELKQIVILLVFEYLCILKIKSLSIAEKAMMPTLVTVIAAIYLFVSLIVLAPKKSGYSHIKHTISEIGESGAHNQRFVAFGLFLPIGISLLIVAYLINTASPAAARLALCIAIGYIGAAVFPCDAGAPLYGSVSHTLHFFAGAVEYIGGAFAMMTLAESLGEPFETAGYIVIGVAIALSFPHPIRGLIQRIAELCLFGSLALAAWQVGGAM